MDIKGHSAIITGGGSGLGAATARELAKAGAKVGVIDVKREAAEAVAKEIGGAAAAADVTDAGSLEAAYDSLRNAIGPARILVACAGVATGAKLIGKDGKATPLDAFKRTIDINLMGTYWMAQACARVMQPGSSIVNISSVLGLVKSNLPQAAYASSKAAVVGLTRDLSQQWAGRRGIRVNAIAPGYFASEMTDTLPPGELEAVQTLADLGRIGEQRELDAAVLFLASDAASYVTGITLAVDGGMTGH